MNEKNELDPMQVINDLAYTRLSGTDNDEKKCKEYLIEKFKQLGFEPRVENIIWSPFATNTLLRIIPAIIYAGLATAIILFLIDKYLVILILIFAIIIGLISAISLQQGKTDAFVKIGKQNTSFNIFVKIHEKKKEKEGKIRDVLFVAHHDTKSQKVTTMVRTISYVAGFLTSIILGLIFIAISIIGLFKAIPLEIKHSCLIIISIIFAIDSIFMIILMYNTTIEGKSLGSLDNATGVAIVLKLLEYYKNNEPPPNVNLWFLITGAEEWGMHGAIGFWQQHAEASGDLSSEHSAVFNFDMVANELNYIKYFGFPKKPYNNMLNNVLEKSAEELNIEINGFWLPMLGTTDGWIFKIKGCETADIITRKMSVYTHSAKDTPRLCDSKTLEKAIAVTIKSVDYIAKI
ncbi:MAG: M28 family metallopeptidase [Promethearchaeota archaeon]